MSEIIQIEMLDTDKYAAWSAKMEFLLKVKGLWSAISSEETVNATVDAKALAQIGLHVKSFHLGTVRRAKSAKEAWDALAGVYQAKSNAKRLQLKRELNALVKGRGEPLTRYLTRATDIRDQLLAAGYEVKDEEIVMSLVAGLPKEFDNVVAVLEYSDKPLKLDEILAKLLLAEQRFTRSDKGEDHAYLGRVDTAGRYKPSTRGAEGSNKGCWYCGKPGHIKTECRKKKAGQAGLRGGSGFAAA